MWGVFECRGVLLFQSLIWSYVAKLNTCISCDPEILFLEMFTQEIPIQFIREHVQGCPRTVCASQELEAVCMFITKGVHKKMWWLHPMEQLTSITQQLKARIRCTHSAIWTGLKNTLFIEKH